MAKLFIGCDYIDFSYADIDYHGVVSKIILTEKIIYRVDYTSIVSNQSGRFEITCIKDEQSDSLFWAPNPTCSSELTDILRTAIERNQRVLQLEC